MSDAIIKIELILASNRAVLKRKFSKGDRFISEAELILEGYNFSFATNRMKCQDDESMIEFVYDFGLKKIEDGCYEILSLRSLLSPERKQ